MVVLDLDVLPPDIKRRNWDGAPHPFAIEEPNGDARDKDDDDGNIGVNRKSKSLMLRQQHSLQQRPGRLRSGGSIDEDDDEDYLFDEDPGYQYGKLDEVKVVVKNITRKTDSMLCCGRRKDQGRDIPTDAEPAASPRRLQLGQISTLPPQGLGRGRELPPMVLQPDFRKVSGISSEIFKQLEAVENDHDATTAAALDAVERRGEMLVRMLDPRNQFNRTRQDLVRKFITMQDGLHTVHFVEIVKRPGQTLGLYIREGNGLDRYDGVFISRIAIESAVFNSGCLGVGDEILAVNLIDVTHMSLDDVVIIMSIPRRLVLTIRQRKGRGPMSGAGSLLRDTSKTPVVVMKKELDEEGYDESNGDMMGHGPHSFSLGPSGQLGMGRGRSPMMTTPGQRYMQSQQMQSLQRQQQQQQGYQPYQAPPHPNTIQSLPRPSPSYQHYANLQQMQLQQSQLPDVTDYTPRITSRRDDFRLETPQPPIRRPQYSDYFDSRPEPPPRPSSQTGYPTSYDWYRSGGESHRQLEPVGPSIAYQPPPPVITEQPRSMGVPTHFQPFDRAYPKTLESLAEKVHTFYTGPRPVRQGRQMRMPRTGSDHRISLSRSGDAQQWYGSMPRQRPTDYRSPAMQQPQMSRYSLGGGVSGRLSAPPRRKPVLDYASDSEAMMYTPSIRSSSGLGALSASTRRSLGLNGNGGRSNSLPRDFIRGRGGVTGMGRKHGVRFDNHKRSTLIPDINSSLAAGRRALLLASGMDSQDESDGAASAPEITPTTRRDRGLGRIVPSSPGVFISGDYRSWLTRAPSTSAIYERLKTNRDLELLQTQRAAKFTYSAENLSLLDRARQDQPYYSYRSHLLGTGSGLTGGDSTLARVLAARSPSASSALASLGIRDPTLRVPSSLSRESLTSTDPLRRLALTPSRSRDLISESAAALRAASPTASLLQRLSERDRDREREREKDAESSIMLRKDILSRSLIGRDLLNRESLLKDDLHGETADSIVSRLTGGAGLSGLTSGLTPTRTDISSITGLTRPDSSLGRDRDGLLSGISGLRGDGGITGLRDGAISGLRDGGITGLRDSGITGLQDSGITGLRDSGISGLRDGGLTGLRDGITGLRDGGMAGLRDSGISGLRDSGLRDSGIQGILTRPSLTATAAAVPAAPGSIASTTSGSAAGDSRLKLLTINPSEFVRYKMERPASAASDMTGPGGMERQRLQLHGHSGILRVHLLAGRALRSTVRATDSSMVRTRDLYCVLECDRVHKARTVVCTGDQNFDWDEVFELDLVDNKELDFLIYSWDPQLRHRLCYKGSVSLLQILSDVSPNSAFHQLAIKVEPRGTLYVKLRHTPPQEAFRREMKKVGLFGADVANVVLREDSGLNVPLIVQRCIEEVERRGLDIIGLYRLCGSSGKKQVLREAFERSPRTVDLSADNVPDINVIAGVLKDYLRELPEPLLTKCLYQMLVDALGVCLPDDPEGNARLLFSIIECLPKPNRCTLLTILEHLSLVCSLCDRNKMGPLQLATSFGPILMVYYDATPESLDFQPPIKVLQYLLEVWPAKSVNILQTVREAGQAAVRKGPTLSTKGRFPRSSPVSALLSKSQKMISSGGSKSQSSDSQQQSLQISPTKQSPGSLSESSPSPTSVHSTKAQNIPAVSSVGVTTTTTSSSSGALTLTPSTTSSSLTSVTTPNSLTPVGSTAKTITPTTTSSSYSITSDTSELSTTVITPTPLRPIPRSTEFPLATSTGRTTGEDIFSTVSVRNRASAFEQPTAPTSSADAPRVAEVQPKETPPQPLPRSDRRDFDREREREIVPPSPMPGRKFQGPGHAERLERASSVEERLKRKLPPLPSQQSFPQPHQYSSQQQPPYSAPFQQSFESQSPFSQQGQYSQRLYSAPFATMQQQQQPFQQQPFQQQPYSSQPLYSSNSSSSSSSTATVIIGNGKLSQSPPVTTSGFSEAQLAYRRDSDSSMYASGSTSAGSKDFDKVPPQPPPKPKPGYSAREIRQEQETNILSGGGGNHGLLRGNGEAKLISSESPPINGGAPFSFQQWNIFPTAPAASAIPAATKYTIESEEFAAAAAASPGPSSKEASPRPTPGSTPPPGVPPPVPPRLDRRPSQTSPTSSSPPSAPPPVPPRLGRAAPPPGAAPVRTPSFDSKEAFEVDCYTIKEENGEEDFLT